MTAERGCCVECAWHSLYDFCDLGCIRTDEPELFRIMTMKDAELLAEPNAERDAEEMREALAVLINEDAPASHAAQVHQEFREES